MAINVTAQSTITPQNAQRYYAEFKKYFTDDICTEMAVPYSAMTDEQLQTTMSNMPQELIDIAVKVKNNAWEKREKEFRVFEAKPYSNPYNWKQYLNVREYSNLQNPTGITADNEYLLIFVGSELPDSIWMELCPVADNMAAPLMTNVLQSGLNMVKIPDTEGEGRIMFIKYYVDTDSTATSKKLADYPNVPIHIEGGYVNGYFDLSRHTDEDWRDLTRNYMKYYSVQVLGKRTMFHMELNNILKACPSTIVDAITWWDECVARQHELMGADKYYDRWNDLIMARDGYENMFMYATETYTYYEHYTLVDILPWEKVYASPGQMWGPAHEIGHVNQGAINIVSCTEASNNLFANVQIFRTGKSTTRGNGVKVCSDDFNNSVPFPLRGADIIAKSRMYFQLYLYFHAAGKDTTFYPRLFEALRKDPMDKGPKDRNWTSLTQAKDDQLKFAEKCCEIAQMDLSEFFDAWGFFEPMSDAGVGDYDNYIVNLTEEEAEASRARMQKYAKKGGHLMFIEDRIKPSKRTDGVDGYRIDYNEEFIVGTMGETGQWEDYIDESVKAEGYYYKKSTNYVTILAEENAKGAVGFKLYNAETGELLSFNNDYSLKIPVSAINAPLKVVAAQADGTDAELQDIAESDSEEMQIEALNAVLSTAKTILGKSTANGREIGYYYASALTTLQSLYDNAKAAADNNDTSIHSFKEWTGLLKAEIERLQTDLSARAYLKNLDEYRIINAKEKSYQLCYDKYGLKANKQSQTAITSDDKKWLVESTGELHHYYIKNKNGLYINEYQIGVGTSCSGEDQSTAVVFKANYMNDGRIYFSTKDEGAYLTLNSDYNVVCTTELVDKSMWTIVRVKENNTGVEEVGTKDEEVKTIYDLQGRKIENPTKGIYIINGKKVLVK
jgi:hypothetical protein